MISFMPNLTSDQQRLLGELDDYGGVMIVRSRSNYHDYEILEKAGLILAEAISTREMRYKLTKAGKRLLESHG
jgi:hypothetical protein